MLHRIFSDERHSIITAEVDRSCCRMDGEVVFRLLLPGLFPSCLRPQLYLLYVDAGHIREYTE